MKQLIHHMTVQKFAIKSGCGVQGFHKTGDNEYRFTVAAGTEKDDFVSRMNDAWFEMFGGPECDVNGTAVVWSLDDFNWTTEPTEVTIHICPIEETRKFAAEPVGYVISAEEILANATPDDRPVVDPGFMPETHSTEHDRSVNGYAGYGHPDEIDDAEYSHAGPEDEIELPKVGNIVQNLQHGGGYTGKVIEINDLGIEVEWHKGTDNTFTDVIWFGGDLVPTWDKVIKVVTSPIEREWWPEPAIDPTKKVTVPAKPSCAVEGCKADATLKVTDGRMLCDAHFREEHGKRLVAGRQSMKHGLQKAADNPNHPKPEAYPKVNGRSPMAPKPKVERKPKAEKPTRPCACGCGKETKNVFAMGHDAKAKKMLRGKMQSMAENMQIMVDGKDMRSWTPSDNLIAYINVSPAWKELFDWVNNK